MYITANTIKRLGIIGFGLCLLYLSFILVVGTITFNPFDPSLNNAVSADRVHNLSGTYGAYFIDSLIQFFGFATIPMGLVFLSWALNLLVNKRIKYWLLRASAATVLVLTLPALMQFISVPEKYIAVSGGGYIGVLLYNYVTQFVDPWVHYAVFSITSFIIFCVAANVSFKEFWRRTLFLMHLTYRFFGFIAKSFSKNNAEEYSSEDVEIKFDDIEEELTARTSIKKTSKISNTRTIKKSDKSLKYSPDAEFVLPPLNLLTEKPKNATFKVTSEALRQQVTLLEQVLVDFGIKGQIIQVKPGPVVTLFELEPAAGTKSARIIGLADDIARSMSALSARIAVVPGKNIIGIELPNKQRETVYFKELLESSIFKEVELKLPLALGKDIGGETSVVDLAKMPHLLVAGTTGSGKSVGINAMILSLLYKLTPDECKFIMIDPKMLELSVYDGIPHLLTPVVTEPQKAVVALKWVVKEMENRYRLMSSLGVRNVAGFNDKVKEAMSEGKILSRRIQTGFDPVTGKPIYETMEIENKTVPYIVVIVDEMADLMLVAGKEIETSIQRLAQMARAAGIHIIMATQRPSVDVITGIIKANFPSRISFQVTSKIDSRTILGDQGAEQLLGMGDMLYMASGGKITRVHGAFVSDSEVEKVVNMLKEQGSPEYIEDVTKSEDEEGMISNMMGGSGDDLYDQAVQIVLRDKKASTSYIQRCLKIGYNRAATIIERMEKEGIVSAANHVGKREILAAE
ncbi:MAG: hypothetical protein BGO27_02155 [Alphaproteobacteria bacterium 33-17]|nr:MAG: hypothetical protein BGO27_02155 [Alphaproteobacteria bacterium 33-17]